MIIIECNKFPKLIGNISVSNQDCFVQVVDDISVVEYKVPIFFDDEKKLSTMFSLDEQLLEFFQKYKFVKVFSEYLDFGEAEYIPDFVEVLETSVPELSCICVLPDINTKEDVTLVLKETLEIHLGQVMYTIPVLYNKKSPSIRVNGNFLKPGLCKLYIGKDVPLGIETSEKIIYLAPIC